MQSLSKKQGKIIALSINPVYKSYLKKWNSRQTKIANFVLTSNKYPSCFALKYNGWMDDFKIQNIIKNSYLNNKTASEETQWWWNAAVCVCFLCLVHVSGTKVITNQRINNSPTSIHLRHIDVVTLVQLMSSLFVWIPFVTEILLRWNFSSPISATEKTLMLHRRVEKWNHGYVPLNASYITRFLTTLVWALILFQYKSAIIFLAYSEYVHKFYVSPSTLLT